MTKTGIISIHSHRGTLDSLRKIIDKDDEEKTASVQITNLSNDSLTQLLLYGDELNKNILKLPLRFIHETGRFD